MLAIFIINTIHNIQIDVFFLVISESLFFFGYTVSLAGSLFPYKGSNPHPLQWKHKVLTTGPPGKSQNSHLLKYPHFTEKETEAHSWYAVKP